MDTPTQQVDPATQQAEAAAAQAQQLAQQQDVQALQAQAQGDTAALMARYGTRLGLAGVSTGSPTFSPANGRGPAV